jgi:hypothetical protein
MIERAEWLAQHDTERMQPWRTAGIDRRTWYRRKARLMALLLLPTDAMPPIAEIAERLGVSVEAARKLIRGAR